MAKPPFRVKALYEYSSPHEDDLSFPGGQLLTVTEEEDDEWYYGEFEDSEGKKQEGLFPKNFVKIYEPETPPRPARSNRAKKEVEHSVEAAPVQEKTISEESSIPATKPSSESSRAGATLQSSDETEVPERETPLASSQTLPPVASSATTKSEPKTSMNASNAYNTKPTAPASGSKPAPPPTADKPASGSFRDRINAFNKSTAAPLAPTKPSGLGSSSGSGFVRKPFVAPPPSKNAYVPPPQASAPQTVYRREDPPDAAVSASAEPQSEEQQVLPQPAVVSEGNTEDHPKPTSLKDRIALLQKQQLEQAARHAEKKDKSRKSAKKPESDQPLPIEEDAEGESLGNTLSSEPPRKRSVESSRDTPIPSGRSIPKSRKSQDETPLGGPTNAPPRELLSDTNDADQSGAADTEGEELSPGRDDSDEKPEKVVASPQARSQVLDPLGGREERNNEDGDEPNEEEEDEEIDPEVKRKMELRERMAKMSGGMGMAGMFGMPGSMPPRAPPKQGTSSSNHKASGESSRQSEHPTTQITPVPMIPMPGLTKVRSPDEVEDHSGGVPLAAEQPPKDKKRNTQDEEQEATSDNDGMREESIPSRRSTDRVPPPPPPQSE